MATFTRATVLLGMATMLVWAPAHSAAQSQADFDACNQQAKAKVSSPSASPGSGLGPGGGATSGGSTMTSPGTSSDANRLPNASGRISGSAGSPGTAAGTTAGGLIDTRLGGMAATGHTDEVYKQAYRDCITGRGF